MMLCGPRPGSGEPPIRVASPLNRRKGHSQGLHALIQLAVVQIPPSPRTEFCDLAKLLYFSETQFSHL